MVLSSSPQEVSFSYVKSVSSCDTELTASWRHSPAPKNGRALFNAQAPEGCGLALSCGSTQLAAWGTDFRVSQPRTPRTWMIGVSMADPDLGPLATPGSSPAPTTSVLLAILSVQKKRGTQLLACLGIASIAYSVTYSSFLIYNSSLIHSCVFPQIFTSLCTQNQTLIHSFTH